MINDPEDNIIGISPLGGNATYADSSTVEEVPLVLDRVTGEYVAEHRAIDQLDREQALEDADRFAEEESFRAKVGFVKTIS